MNEETISMSRWTLNYFIDAIEQEPDPIKEHYERIKEHVEYVITTVDGTVGNLYSPLTRAEVDLYKQQIENAIEPAFLAMKQYAKEIKTMGYENMHCKEVIEQFQSVIKSYIRLVEKTAKGRLPSD